MKSSHNHADRAFISIFAMDSTFGPPRLLCLIKGVVRATQPKMHSLWHLMKLLVPYVGCACASQMQILVLIDKKIEVLALSEQISLWHVGNGLSWLMMQKNVSSDGTCGRNYLHVHTQIGTKPCMSRSKSDKLIPQRSSLLAAHFQLATCAACITICKQYPVTIKMKYA